MGKAQSAIISPLVCYDLKFPSNRGELTTAPMLARDAQCCEGGLNAEFPRVAKKSFF